MTKIITFNGQNYKVRGNVEIPDLESMGRFDVLIWINQNTYAKGYQKQNPLAGLADAIEVGAA